MLRPWGSLLVTVPLGERGDHGWFRQDDVRGWTRLYTRTGFFVEEQEPYELTDSGWKPAPAFKPAGVRYGEHVGLRRRRSLHRALTQPAAAHASTGAARALKRRVRPLRHRGTERRPVPTIAAMDFALTDEQRGIQSLAREFAEAEIVPHAAEWDREHRFPPRSSRGSDSSG